jgi:hypothetical protein
MRSDYAQRGFSAPDGATARESHVGEGVKAPNLAGVKDFVKVLRGHEPGQDQAATYC